MIIFNNLNFAHASYIGNPLANLSRCFLLSFCGIARMMVQVARFHHLTVKAALVDRYSIDIHSNHPRTLRMRSFALALVGLLASVSSASASSFHADVVRRTHAHKNTLRKQRVVNDELLEKAIPVEEYEKKYGVTLNRQLQENYEMDENDMYSFSGYSLTFAKCQPVQYFSDEAVEMGSYSPMITEDIVVLRLCPTNACSDSKEYGCYYNYAEYAIELEDYMNIMLRYAAQKKEYMCQYCNDCLGGGNRRRLEDAQDQADGGQEDANENQQNDGEQQDEQQQDEQQNYDEQQQQEQQQEDQDNGDQQQQDEYNQQQEEDAAAAGDDAVDEQANDYYDDNAEDGQGDDYYKYACGGWDTYCSDYAEVCVEDENNGGNQYMDYEEYLNYLECTEVEYNGGRYYVKPRCDGSKNTIKMTVHYDAYCMQASGNEMSIKNFGLGMRDSTFQDFYSGNCVDCSESVSSEIANFFLRPRCTDTSFIFHFLSINNRIILLMMPLVQCATWSISLVLNA